MQKKITNSLEQKLTKYGLAIRGKSKKINYSINKSPYLLMVLPVVGLSQLGNAQCLGSVNSNNVINIAGNGGTLKVDLNGDGIPDMRFRNPQLGGGSLYVSNIGSGDVVNFFTDGNTSVQPFTGAVGGANLKGTGVFVAYSDGVGGAIRNGQTKYFGFTINDGTNTNEGFMQLTVNHDGGSTYQIQIPQRGTSINGSANAGDCNSLPVELKVFTATTKNNSVYLSWQTATEFYNAGFEVQRSIDGENFEIIDFIEGKGTSLDVEDYEYIDKNIRIEQQYYYRLKQVDYNGNFDYSPVITAMVAVNKAQVGDFYPNPTNGQVQIEYTTTSALRLTATVFSLIGQEQLRTEQDVLEGENTLNFNFSALPKGTYFVKLQAGEDIQYQKLVIN